MLEAGDPVLSPEPSKECDSNRLLPKLIFHLISFQSERGLVPLPTPRLCRLSLILRVE